MNVAPHEATFSAAVKSAIYPDIKFELDVRVHQDGVVRVRMDEVQGLRKRYDEAASWALISEPSISRDVQWTVGKKDVRASYGGKGKEAVEVVVQYEPLRVTLSRGGKEQVVLNGRGLLHMEHFRTKESVEQARIPRDVPEEGLDVDANQVVMGVNPNAWFEGEEDAWFEETFGTWTDSKPKGTP